VTLPRFRSLRRPVALALAALGCSTWAAGGFIPGASAAAQNWHATAGAGSSHASATDCPPGDCPSKIWSGYAQTSSKAGTFWYVESSWTIPKVDTKIKGVQVEGDWVGIDGFSRPSDHKLIQAGTLAENANGKAVYKFFYELVSSDPEKGGPEEISSAQLPAHPGDQVVVAVAKTSGDSWEISIYDSADRSAANGGFLDKAVSYSSPGYDVEVIHERPLKPPVKPGKAQVPFDLARTSSVPFTSAIVGTGRPGGSTKQYALGSSIPGARLFYISMVSGKTTIALPSRLTDDGTCFQVTDGSKRPAPPSASVCGRST
jgi:Peptidase A4 family